MTGLGNGLALSLFVPQSGTSLVIYIIGSLIIGLAFLLLLMNVPPRMRKPLVMGITFIMGWFYLLEFFIPGTRGTAPARHSFTAAQSHILRVSQNLNAVAGFGLTPQQQAQRVSLVSRQIDEAVSDLKAGQDSANKLLPALQRKYDAAAARSDRFASDHKLKDTMIARGGDGKIMDQSTNTLGQRISDIGTAVANANAVINGDGKKGPKHKVVGLMEIKAGLAGLTPATAGRLSGAASKDAEVAGLSASSISANFLTSYKDVIGNVAGVIGAFTIGLGILNLLTVHFHTIARRRLGWPSSIAFYLSFLAIAVLGFVQKYAAPTHASGKLGSAGYDLLFNGALSQLQSTMFALVAFYIVTAAYRAFRVRSAEAALMMVSALIVMLAFVPIGSALTNGLHGNLSFLRLENIREWILSVPNASAQRGMAFGIGVGALAMQLRLWLSLERGSYFDKAM